MIPVEGEEQEEDNNSGWRKRIRRKGMFPVGRRPGGK